MEHGFYHPQQGYWQTNESPAREILSAYPEGTIEVPPKPGAGFTYNGSGWVAPTTEWVLENTARQVRSERDHLLARTVDPIVTNPLRWADLTQEQRDALSAYRKALLDVPTQSKFPMYIDWPAYPL